MENSLIASELTSDEMITKINEMQSYFTETYLINK